MVWVDDPVDRGSVVLEVEAARLQCGLGRFEMWVRYFSMGGQASPLELDALFNNSMAFTDTEYNIVVRALNERFEEVGVRSPLVLRPVDPADR